MPFTTLDPANAQAAPTTTIGAPLTSVGETLLSIETELASELGGRTDVTTTRLRTWINYAYRNLAGMLNIRELKGSLALSLTASQALYLLPTCVASVEMLSVVDTTDFPIRGGRELELTDKAEYRRLPDQTEEPTKYFRDQRMLVLYPTPLNARTVALDFKVRPNDLVNTTDSPILPIEWHEPLLIASRVRALRGLQNWADAVLAQNDFVSTIRPLLDTDAEENMERNGTLQPMRTKAELYMSPRGSRWER